ncbi:MAG: PD-(D/E)XK nuclease family protein, partial [bacterium]|nr:PD-(D/E)XK nuclease family protein [bacterium]
MAEYIKKLQIRSGDWNYGGFKWKLSRSKLDLFTECPRCFYLDNKLGVSRPKGPSFTLNLAVDTLLKKEFDIHRAKKTSHPLMKKYGVGAVPFSHEKLDEWRENFKGIQYVHPKTGVTISGAIDDIWVNPAGELIIVDYKATAKDGKIETLSDSGWDKQYKKQMEVYQWLFRRAGFKVSATGYFVYVNGRKDKEAFDGKLEFDVTLIAHSGD